MINSPAKLPTRSSPDRWITIPNLLSFARLAMMPLAVSTISGGRYRQALVVFAAVAVTDCLDGFLARRLNCITRVGAYLDPIADKALLSGVYLAMGIGGVVPWWLVGIVFGRDVAILAAAGSFMLFGRRHDLSPSIWGKTSTFIQISAVIVLIVGRAFPQTGAGAWEKWIPLPVAVMTCWSAAHYAWRALRES